MKARCFFGRVEAGIIGRKIPKGKQQVRFRFPEVCLASLPFPNQTSATAESGLRCASCLKAFILYGSDPLEDHDIPLELRKEHAVYNEPLGDECETRKSWPYWKKQRPYHENEILPLFRTCLGYQHIWGAMQKKLRNGTALESCK